MKLVEDRWELDGRNRVLAIGVGLSPLWLLAFFYLTDPHIGGGLYQPTAAEVQANDLIRLVVFGVTGLLMLAGTVSLWRARSARAAVSAALLLTVPSVLVMLFAPAFVLIWANLNT